MTRGRPVLAKPTPPTSPTPRPPTPGSTRPSASTTRPAPSAADIARAAAANPNVQRSLLLRDVLEHSARVEREITTPKRLGRSRRRHLVLAALCVALLAVSAYSWIARPEGIWGPHPSSRMTPARSQANLRVALFLAAQRVEKYRALEGAYPRSLAEAGADTTLRYVAIGDSAYRVSARLGAAEITLKSGEDVDAFLGNSFQLIQGGPRP